MISIRLYKYNEDGDDGELFLPNYTIKVYKTGRKLPYERQYKSRRLADECIDWLEGFYTALGMPVEIDA